jgi:hypothetical protein
LGKKGAGVGRVLENVLTLDEDPDADYDGIKIINALRWLLGRDMCCSHRLEIQT